MTAPVWKVSSLLAVASTGLGDPSAASETELAPADYIECGATPGNGACPVVTSERGAGVPDSLERREGTLPGAQDLPRLTTNMPGNYRLPPVRAGAPPPEASLLVKTIFTKLRPMRRCDHRHDGSGGPKMNQKPWSEASRGSLVELCHGPGNLDS